MRRADAQDVFGDGKKMFSEMLHSSRVQGTPRAWRRVFGGFAAFFLFFVLCPCLAGAADLQPRLEVARQGEDLVAALHLTIPAGFHAYGHDPGESGRPTSIDFSVGGAAFPVRYPQGALQRDYYDPSATVFVYEDAVSFFVFLPPDAPGKPYAADISILLCSRHKCLPLNERVTGIVPQAEGTVENTSWRALWEASREGTPSGEAVLSQEESEEAAADVSALSRPALPPPDTFAVQLSSRFMDASLEIAGLGKALLLGVLAGLLLNFMPCVLPVLTFKVSGLLLVDGCGREGIRRFREHNLFFAAGIMTLFSALAMLLGLADLMWGQLYQSQAVLLVMLLVVFLMGLSMLGVFTLPVIDLKAGSHSSSPRLQAYATGLISTFLATPCSGPLLGGVLGWAFTQPLYIIVIVFWAVGLGMALPYMVLSIRPDFARILPRPGTWMRTFERIVGFCLLGTALYLLSILPAQKHMDVLCVLLVAAMGVWLWGQYCGIAAPVLRRRLVGGLVVLLLAGSVFWILRPAAPLPRWADFTPETFTRSLGEKPLLLEFTADWCPNCKFVEATVLTDERLRKWQAMYNVTFLRVDMTSANAYATRLLEGLGSKSIPLTALFPAGNEAQQPLVLRDVYSVQTLERALEQAFVPSR